MAEKEICVVALELSSGGQVYLKSTWEQTSFSIVVLDGVHAWSRTVTAKEVVSIATSWEIDVREFMISAQSHLCQQHPASEYSITVEKDASVVQLSFTIDDLGQETLNFALRLTRMSDVGAAVRETLEYLLDSKGKLEAQLAESQLQKKREPEPEPSITLSLARPGATLRRQSSLVEPRILDFAEFSRSEGIRSSVCTRTPTRADTATASRPLAPVPNFKSREKVRSDDITARPRFENMLLSPKIRRVLDNLSGAGPWEDERGVKVMQMRSPARRRTTIFEDAVPKDVPMNRSASFSESDKLPEKFEKSSSNHAGGSGTCKKLPAAKEGSDVEEPISRVTDLRAKAEKARGQRSHEGRSTEEPVENEAPEEIPRTKDIIGGVSSKMKHTPECRRSGRKRTAEADRDRDVTLGSVKREFEDPSYETSEPRPRRNAKVKHDYRELFSEETASEDTNRDTFQTPDPPRNNTVREILEKMPVAAGEGRARLLGKPPKQSTPQREIQLRRRMSRASSEEGHVLDPEVDMTNFVVPDPDYYNFDKERTEDHILPNQIWAVYDEKDGFPRVWARINTVTRHPKFQASITWLTPHKPSEEAENFFATADGFFEVLTLMVESQLTMQMTGYAVSCGAFENGSEGVLDSINTFSHKMEFGWVSSAVVTIYPKKGEVWAIYKGKMVKSAFERKMVESAFEAPGDGVKRPQFLVVHILEDVEPEKPPVFAVLERVRRFRTVYSCKADYDPGSAALRCLVLFSHRVPAHQLQGNEAPSACKLKGSWDVDPAGLPTVEGDL